MAAGCEKPAECVGWAEWGFGALLHNTRSISGNDDNASIRGRSAPPTQPAGFFLSPALCRLLPGPLTPAP